MKKKQIKKEKEDKKNLINKNIELEEKRIKILKELLK